MVTHIATSWSVLDVGFGATLCLHAAQIHLLLQDLHLGIEVRRLTEAWLRRSQPGMSMWAGSQIHRLWNGAAFRDVTGRIHYRFITIRSIQTFPLPLFSRCAEHRFFFNWNLGLKSGLVKLTFPPPG